MAKLKVLRLNSNCLYVFENEDKKQISLQLELYGISKLNKDDVVNICDKLLDKKSDDFVQPYAFEKCDLADFSKLDKNEKMIVERKDEKVLLKRIYG